MPVIIRPSEPRDISAIQQLYSCPKAQAGTLQLPLPSLSLWEKRMNHLPENTFSLVADENNVIVGQLGFHVSENQRRRHVGEFGMAVHDDHVGKGVGSKLVEKVIDLADNWLNLRRIELTVYCDNEAAIALYKKFGFGVEGTAIGYAFRNGRYVDAHYMARLNPSL
ncbi:GNAT family N-acetyltransferase [Enterovibrio norvegicus]|uniref:GNAT family N-acetyltransferase n=1 Tax=Enterovibrio norvegicus TaxID=188144 RepID=UPI000C855A7A|nr:GNAT family N-acetyltransferase [Enterovibrio norvegicus]PML81659.1 GNAT family N-acetyltransferase [Enterovibrio norvegicus]